MTVSSIINESRLAIRRALRHPWIALFKALVLGIGIAAASSIFSVYYAFMHQTLPFKDADRLMYVGQTSEGRPTTSSMTTFHSFEAIKAENNTLEAIGTAYNQEKELRSGEIIEFVEGVETSPNYLEVLGSEPIMGTIYTEADWDQFSERPVALSHDLWVTTFNSSPDILGKIIYLNERVCRVVAVMEPAFMVPRFPWMESFYLHPIARSEIVVENMKSRWFASVGRLKPDASLATLLADLAPISERVSEKWPTMMNRRKLDAMPLRDFVTRNYADSLTLLNGAAFFVLIVAMANLVVISFGESNTHRHSEAIRQYFGARWQHRLTSAIFENLPNALAGSLIGLALGDLMLRWVGSYYHGLPVDISQGFQTRLIVAFCFAFSVAVVNGTLYTVFNRLRAKTLSTQAFRQGSRVTSSQFNKTLLVVEITASAIVLILIGLFTTSQIRRLNVDRVVETDKIYAVYVTANPMTMPGSRDRLSFYNQLIDEVSTIPGVASVAASRRVAPYINTRYSFIERGSGVTLEESDWMITRENISDTFFDTVGLRILEGRNFNKDDMRVDSERTLIINQALREVYWPDENPIGRYVKINHRTDVEHWARIIGVVENQLSMGDAPTLEPYAYRPNSTYMYSGNHLVIRMESADTPLDKEAVEEAIRKVGPGSVFYDIRTLDEMIRDWNEGMRNLIRIMLVFAGIIIGLTITGVIAFYYQSITLRRPEFDLRMILGATPGRIRKGVSINGFIVGCIGFALAIPIAYLLGTALKSYLYDISPGHPLIYGTAFVGLLVIILISLIGPLLSLIKERRSMI